MNDGDLGVSTHYTGTGYLDFRSRGQSTKEFSRLLSAASHYHALTGARSSQGENMVSSQS